MGTQGAYGGSPGWKKTRDDTGDWLGSSQSPRDESDGAGGNVDTVPSDEVLAPEEQLPVVVSPEETPKVANPAIVKILSRVTSRLASSISTISRTGDGKTGRPVSSGGGSWGGRRSGSVVSGGAAIAAAYGVTSRNAEALRDVGLTLDELDGLNPFEQARRIVNATSGKLEPIEEDEIRIINANFILWALYQDGSPPPEQLVKAWLTEFVYRVWLTEAGAILRDGSRNGASTHALEKEVRVTLEAAVTRVRLPSSGLRAVDFQHAIEDLLGQLTRIFSEVAA